MLDARELIDAGPAPGLAIRSNGVLTRTSLAVDARQWPIDGLHRGTALVSVIEDSIVPVVLVADATTPTSVTAAADIVLTEPGVGVGNAVEVRDVDSASASVCAGIAANAGPALTLVWLLRLGEQTPIVQALAAESAAYSTLLAGPDHHAWLGTRRPPRDAGPLERVRTTRDGDRLQVTLARPSRRNAVDSAMRDALLQALDVAIWDHCLRVLIDAEGPSFCAGGDLDEFGSAPDPATAHVVRVAAGLGRILHVLRDRTTVRVHGSCIGAGVELPAFAGHVVATADSRFQLPEIGMGLIPGAGGTVSIPRRISRARTAWLAVTGAVIDALTALSWGLVDEIVEGPSGTT